MVQFIRGTRIKWAGHVQRADESMLKGALTYMVRRRRPRERPQKIWKDIIKELLEEIGVNLEQAYDKER